MSKKGASVKKFKKILCGMLACVMGMTVFTASGCSYSNDSAQNKLGDEGIKAGITIFEYNASDAPVKHDMGKAFGNTWKVGIENFNGLTSVLQNEGNLAYVENVSLRKGNYQFNADISVFAEQNKSSTVNLSNPVAAVQVLDSTGTVVANQHVFGSVTLFSDEYLAYPVAFEVPEKGTYSFRIFNTGLCGVSVEKLALYSVEPTEMVASTPVSVSFEESEEQKNLTYDANKLYCYDLHKDVERYGYDFKNLWDISTLIVALQGIVNREKPTLFVRFDTRGYQTGHAEMDLFWLDYLSEERDFLPAEEDRIWIDGIDTLLRLFADKFKGLVLWDNDVPSTSNVAMTDAGVNDNLPVRYTADHNSIYHYLKGKYPVMLDLVNRFTGSGTIWDTKRKSTGSAKCDAYIWALEKYIKTDKVDKYTLSNYLDGWVGTDGFMPVNLYMPSGARLNNGTVQHGGNPTWTTRIWESTVMQRDYNVAQRSFFIDLLFTDLHTPVDDPEQPVGADLSTLEEILREMNKRATDGVIEVGGLTKWESKYSNHIQPGATAPGNAEGISSRLFTKYNCIFTADGFIFCNASIYRLYKPAADAYVNKNREAMQAAAANRQLENKNYVLFYMGDYDSASWLNRSIPTMFNDPRLGDYPLMWPIIPINESRASHVYEYMYSHMSNKDVMVGGNNGLGYIYWSNLLGERNGLNGTLDDYVETVKKMNKKYDIDVMGVYFSGENFNTMQEITRTLLMEKLAECYPVGVALSGGHRHIYEVNGTVFTGKDPGKFSSAGSAENLYQAGVLQLLTDSAADFNSGIMANAVDCRKENRPMFHVCRVILVPPTDLFNAFEEMQRKYPDYDFEIVDPYAFYKLYKEYRDKIVDGDYPALSA